MKSRPLRIFPAFLIAFCLCQCASPRSRNPLLTMEPPLTEWTARDGKTLPCKYWPGEPRNPKGVIICVHGLSGAASDFWPVGESFPQKGYAVYGLQLRGQGNDPDVRRRGDIRSASQWQQDLLDFTALVSRRHSGIPVYWFGESLGALIAINTTGSLGEAQASTVHDHYCRHYRYYSSI